MSRKLASISEFVVDALTYFSSARQKSKTLARLMKGLSERSYGVIKCNKAVSYTHLTLPTTPYV